MGNETSSNRIVFSIIILILAMIGLFGGCSTQPVAINSEPLAAPANQATTVASLSAADPLGSAIFASEGDAATAQALAWSR